MISIPSYHYPIPSNANLGLGQGIYQNVATGQTEAPGFLFYPFPNVQINQYYYCPQLPSPTAFTQYAQPACGPSPESKFSLPQTCVTPPSLPTQLTNTPFPNFKVGGAVDELPESGASTPEVESERKERLETCSIGLNYSSYVRRNVCKSIIRNLNSYLRKNRSTVYEKLQRAGYLHKEVKEQVVLLKTYSESQLKQAAKTFQKALEEILDNKIILTYLLKEVLDQLLNSWKEGSHGKVALRNLKSYKDISLPYYNRAVEILAKERPVLLAKAKNSL
eukprot:TRINITY_DN7533_c0_g1_i7.p1 TRINITY_DN7533_c0_g1~~TRINITY_DN7533_c0_g1_i7.p1  ORF type:complete len:277 (+),score=23.94 TRINITY_DN7533_c0_g1_i7:223-1053(+)